MHTSRTHDANETEEGYGVTSEERWKAMAELRGRPCDEATVGENCLVLELSIHVGKDVTVDETWPAVGSCAGKERRNSPRLHQSILDLCARILYGWSITVGGNVGCSQGAPEIQ